MTDEENWFDNLEDDEFDRQLQDKLKEIDDKYADQPTAAAQSLDDETMAQFEELARTQDMLEYWYPAINPKIVGMDDIKRAVVLSIASAGDYFGDRGRIHILMYGDPGTAKTMITDWLVFHQGAVGASMRTSRVGLTADASGNEVTLGALPKANDGIICLDERLMCV